MFNNLNNRNIIIISSIAVLLLVVGLGVWYVSTNSQNSDPNNSENSNLVSNPNQNPFPSNNEIVNKSTGRYIDYSPSFFSNLKNGDMVVLFFKSNWCTTCNGLDEDITANFNKIPENVYIMRVNFDSDLNTNAKYGAFVQHTLVATNHTGEMMLRWTGSPTLNDLLGYIAPPSDY